MGLLLSTRRIMIASTSVAWTPALPTSDGGVLPEHWYRSDQGLWQDAGVTPAASDGDVVGRWEDIAANADHVNQAVAANKPTLQNGVADLLNGHPVIRFDGVNDYLQGAFTTGGAIAQPFTVFAVAKLTSAGAAFRFLTDGDDAVSRLVLWQNNTAKFSIFFGNALDDGASDTAWHYWSALAKGANSELWIDGTSVISGNAGANAPDGLTIGASATGTNRWVGDVAEIIIYASELSAADRVQVETYLDDRY